MRPPVEQCITFLRTPDLAATAHFYEAVLGLELLLDQGDCRIYRWAGDGYLGFCRTDEPLSEPHRVVLTIVAQDVEGWHAHLTAHGVETDGPPRDNATFRITHFYAADPSGYRLEVQRFWDDVM